MENIQKYNRLGGFFVPYTPQIHRKYTVETRASIE
jgi:hypothetical protein